MTIFNNNNQFDNSNVSKLLDNTILYDKNYFINSKEHYNYIDYGLSIINRDIIKYNVNEFLCYAKNTIKNQKYKLEDLFHLISLNYSLTGHEVFERFYEIGSFQGLKDFEEYTK